MDLFFSHAAIYNTRVDINSHSYGNFLLFVVSAVFLSVAFVLLIQFFLKKSILAFIGQASLTILGIHIMLGIGLGFISKLFIFKITYSYFGVVMYIFLFAFIQTLLCLLIYRLFKKLNLKFLL
jgi:hypothetical protein